jgi:hypothetical protein
MKNWIQKSLIISVALLTFGAISPNHIIWGSLLEEKSNEKLISSLLDNETYAVDWTRRADSNFIDEAVESARHQSLVKFGNRIGPVITNEFEEIIFPKIQEAIETTVYEMGTKNVKSLAISENPSGEHSEKIFHIFDETTGMDLLRFHVRTDKKPIEGYYFNFHYHKADDEFAKHYVLGDIYWSKNSPPKWLS